jgi:RNA exonuclease 4
MKPFFTKKQKHLMKERRKKKKQALQGTVNATMPSRATTSSTATASAAGAGVAGDILSDGASSGRSSRALPLAGSKKRRRDASPDGEPEPPKETVGAASDGGTAAGPGGEVSTSSYRRRNASTVVVPANLSSKETRKFRKDARRRARLEGIERIDFVDEKDVQKQKPPEDEPPPKGNKKRKMQSANGGSSSFPRINDLVRQAQDRSELENRMQKARSEEEALPEALKRRYVALDCEMVGIGTDGKTSVLARVSIVDWDYGVLLDTYVQVESRVVDFRTRFSGIKPKHIRGALKPDVVRTMVADIIKDRIVVGHALQNDFHAIMLQHPKNLIRDTAKYRPFQRFHKKWRPRKLRDLVLEHLGKTIQEGSHDSVTDAASTMELFRLVRSDWERELDEKKSKKK